MDKLQIISKVCLEKYKEKQPITILKHLNKLKKNNISIDDFKFYMINSACNSSMIEGCSLDTETYYKLLEMGGMQGVKDYDQTNDLIQAYEFATKNKISDQNLLKAHGFLSKHLSIQDHYKGKIRDRQVYIFSGSKKIYTGADISIVDIELKKLLHDIELLINRELTLNEIFYYASMIHLVFAKIHPFADGNGRVARLLEKWFLSEKIGEIAWSIKSEKLYFQRIKSYYKNIHIGNEYNNVDYQLACPFLLMLPMALRLKEGSNY